MIFADTSLLLETLVGQGERRALAERALRRAGRIATTDAVLSELWTLLWVRGHRHRATPATLVLAGTTLVLSPTDEDRRRATTIMTDWDDQPFSYCDALSFAVMEANQIETVLTFDRHFSVYRYGPRRRQAFTVLP